ncbi:ABC transporter permease [Celeribacter sp. SCSIO 80788]|uniref:ABC transporter permease n=1 Tax=Celeribacter sp. SCSIO 80788 TaxID=3117013 RepID=UPI003DA43866
MSTDHTVRMADDPLPETKRRPLVTPMFLAMALPPAVFLAWGLFVPMISVVVFGFWRTEDYTLIPDFTLENYVTVLTDPSYLTFLWRSFAVATMACAISMVITWPAAYFIAKHGGRWKTILLLAIAAPFFTGLILRLVAFQALLGPVGVMNMLFAEFNLPALDFMMFNRTATVMGLVYLYAPFMLVPIALSLNNFDFNLVEAAKVNGASPLRAFFEVTWPLNWMGTVVGILIVFIPALAESVTPKFLGGPSGTSMGGTISHQFTATGTWSLGAALGVVLFSLSIAVVALLARTVNLRRSGVSLLEE